MRNIFSARTYQRGFTVPEVLMTMVLVGLIASFTFMHIFRPQAKSSHSTSIATLMADLKNQQIKAMLGSTNQTSAVPHGVYIESSRYTLFEGSSYSASDPRNFVIQLSPDIQLSSSLPGNTIVFTRNNGEVSGYTVGSDRLTITSLANNEQKAIRFNRYGAITLE